MPVANFLSLLTQETRRLMEDSVAYRDDYAFGDGVRDIAKVVPYEVVVLGNTDIPETVLRLYSDRLTEGERETMELYLGVQDPEEDIEELVMNQTKLGQIALDLAKRVTGNPEPQCVWLASYDTVLSYYNGTDDTIRAYAINPDVCILSDIGYDGVLVAY